MNGTISYRWSIFLAAMAAIVTCSISAAQGVTLGTALWRGIVVFAMVWAFQWTLCAAWEIMGDETPTKSPRVRRGGA